MKTTLKFMFMTFIVFMFMFISLTFYSLITFTYANDIDNGTLHYCRSKYPDNYRMINYCYDRQIRSAHNVYVYWNKYVKPYKHDLENMPDRSMIVYRCVAKWQIDEYDTCNFPMIKYCIENEFKAYDLYIKLKKGD